MCRPNRCWCWAHQQHWTAGPSTCEMQLFGISQHSCIFWSLFFGTKLIFVKWAKWWGQKHADTQRMSDYDAWQSNWWTHDVFVCFSLCKKAELLCYLYVPEQGRVHCGCVWGGNMTQNPLQVQNMSDSETERLHNLTFKILIRVVLYNSGSQAGSWEVSNASQTR